MAISRNVAQFNRRVWNPLVRGVAERVPPFAVLIHRGRVSGRIYHTPVAAFPAGDEFLIALVFGSRSDWVKNVLAQGGADLVRGGHAFTLTNPELRPADPMPTEVPVVIRAGLRGLHTKSFLVLERRA